MKRLATKVTATGNSKASSTTAATADKTKVLYEEQARVAQLVARQLAVPEIRVQTPPGAN